MRQIMSASLLLTAALCCRASVAGPSTRPAPASAAPVKPFVSEGELAGYKLVWSDEFNTNTVDDSAWDYRTGGRLWSFQSAQNVSVSDGLLHIALKKQPMGGMAYTAGGVISKQTFQYGYFEARFRCPQGKGWHTAFWMMGNHLGEQRVEEVDICEQDSVNNRSYSAGVIDWHAGAHRKQLNVGRKYYENTPDFAADFHVWGCEFTPDRLRFFLDGKFTHSADAAQFAHLPEHIWLSCVAAPYGRPVRTDKVDDSHLPAESMFDWVRVYQK
jgi:beta-glucanase (GH16 family)